MISFSRIAFVNALIVFLIWVICIVSAISLPISIRDDSAVADMLVRVVDIFFSIEQYGTSAEHRQLQQVVFSLAWLSFPSLCMLFIRFYRTRKKGLLVQSRANWTLGQSVAVFLTAVIFGLLGVVPIFLMKGTDTRLLLFGSNLYHLGLFALAIPGSAALFLTGSYCAIQKMLRDKF